MAQQQPNLIQNFQNNNAEVEAVNVTRDINADTTDPSAYYAQQAQVTEIDGVPTQRPAPDPTADFALTGEQLQALEQKYGVKLEELAYDPGQQQPTQQQTAPPVPEQQVTQQPPPPQYYPQPAAPAQMPAPGQPPQQRAPLTQQQLDAANQAYKQATGIDPVQVYQQLQSVESLKQEFKAYQQLENLRRDWGPNYDERIKKVYEYYENMPDPQRQRLNAIGDVSDAAKYVYAIVEQTEASNPANVPPNPLETNRGRQVPVNAPPANSQRIYTYDEIMTMKPSDGSDPFYSEEVRKAFAEGRVRYY